MFDGKKCLECGTDEDVVIERKGLIEKVEKLDLNGVQVENGDFVIFYSKMAKGLKKGVNNLSYKT